MSVAANRDRILEALRISSHPLDDDQLSERSQVRPRQQVNQICRALESAGLIRRYEGHDRKIVNELVARADIVLVGCAREKRKMPAAARDLYVSALFRKSRAYAESVGVPWFILSAEHALVSPDQLIAPYDRYLPSTPDSYRAAWGLWTVERLALLAGPLHGRVVEVHAGADYVNALAPHLAAKGARIVDRLEGLRMGERLGWYDARIGDIEVLPGLDAAPLVERLLAAEAGVSPAEFLATKGVGLGLPGLYSWWVDPAGADDLSAGLGHPISPGFIYAGLAGATLWSRIAKMHLGGNHEFSTLRRTLGAVLRVDEARLTTWMHGHLRVVAVPCADAEALGRLEELVLEEIDPPLNLKGMARTPVRTRISELRRNYRGGG